MPPPSAGEKVIISGWLTKKGSANAFSSGKQWNRRFFTLTNPASGPEVATLRYFSSDGPASQHQPRGEATVRTDSSVRVLDTEASLAEFGLTDKFAGKRVFVFQPKPGDKDPARGAFILEADSSATMHAWITALSEAVSEARHTAAGGAGGGVTSAAAGNERTDASADASGQPQRRKRFLGALERAGLVGPLGGPAIRNLPGAVWETPAFIDLMADAMLTKEAVERRRVALATGDAVGALRPLVKSATDVGRALGQLAVPTTPEESAALADARQALVGLGDLALGCPAR